MSVVNVVNVVKVFKLMLMKYLFLVFVVLISACTTAPTSEQWPLGMPSRAYLQEYYNRDVNHKEVLSEKAYLNWAYRFYNGWELYSRGWFEATDELVESLQTPREKNHGREVMEEIGWLIGPEWAKSDPYRSITTRHVALWGNVILEGMVNDDQFPLLYQIRSDVKQLLAGDIAANAIKKSRYMVEDAFADVNDDDF